MSEFKVGDKVVCVSVGTSRYLKVGREYTVASFSHGGEYLMVREIEALHTYYPSRFVLANFNLENK
jgi:hypothetical protein